jgi:hypothetical protein
MASRTQSTRRRNSMPWKICRWRSLSTCLAAAIARPTACWIRLGPFLGNFRRGGRSCKRSLTTYTTTPRSVTSTPAQPKQRGMPVPSSAAWRAARTMQLYRAVIFRAVERDQHVIAQPTEEGEPAASLQHFERVGKQRMEALRLRGPTYPEHGCCSESAPSKQRLAVRATMPGASAKAADGPGTTGSAWRTPKTPPCRYRP